MQKLFNFTISGKGLGTALLVPGTAIVGTALLLVLATSGSVKLVAATIFGALLIVMALVSGNQRLFCLWCLMVAIPFDLSKRFGPIIAKMGGETSLRVEFSDVFLLALLAFLIRDLWTGYRARLQVPPVIYVWLAIAAMGVATMAFGTYRLTAFHEVVRMLKVALLFLVVCNEIRSPKRAMHAAAALTLGVLLQSTVALYQYGTHQHLGLDFLGETGAGTTDQLAADTLETERSFRVGAFLNHPNIFGAYLACLLPIAVGLFLTRTGKWIRLLALTTVVLGGPALIVSLSRSGWLSLAVAITAMLILMLFHKKLRPRMIVPAAGASVLALGILVAFSGPISERIFESKPDAVLGRAEYLKTAWGVISQRPILGWGLNSYVYVAPPFTRYGARLASKIHKNWLPPVHNIYLLWWAETGIVGLAVHLWMLAWILRIGWRNLRVRDETLFIINVACLCGVLALMVDGMFSFTLRINSMLRVFWVLAALIYAINYWHLRNPPEHPRLA